MPEQERELAATRIALLELKEERRLMLDGYELLDEKCMQLAAEIRHQAARLKALTAEHRELENAARAMLDAAIGRHGLEELSVYPPLSLEQDALHLSGSRLLGVPLLSTRLSLHATAEQASMPAFNPSPEARACARAHRQLLQAAVALATCQLNIRRLLREYARTQRRARAIENVLMPEVETAIAQTEEHLEGVDQEDIVRVRLRPIRTAWPPRP